MESNAVFGSDIQALIVIPDEQWGVSCSVRWCRSNGSRVSASLADKVPKPLTSALMLDSYS